MHRNVLFLVLLIASVFLPVFGKISCPDMAWALDAKAAIIMDAQSGEVYFSKNPDTKYPPASTAKIMTAIVAIENLSLDGEITPTARALNVQPTIAGLKAGTSYKVKDLLAALLIKSANDAARTLAEGVAGSEKDFAAMMNDKAAKLGMKNTHFATASGLPTGKKDSQYITARDLATLMRYAAFRHAIILELMSQKKTEIYGDDDRRICLLTHNKTLYRPKGVTWGKTGFTRQAKHTFVGVDPSPNPRIVISLLKSDALWRDVTTLKEQGLRIYEKKHKPYVSNVVDWVTNEK